MKISKPELRSKINSYFDLNEFKTLCFDLQEVGVEYDNLDGSTLNLKIQALIGFLERRGELTRLVDMCRELRPKVNWDGNDENIDGYYTYRFRAECHHDVNELYKLIHGNVRSIKHSQIIVENENSISSSDSDFVGFPDVEVELETNLSLPELRKAMLQVVDGHVMVQTINYSGAYSGKRNWSEYDVDGNELSEN